MSIEARINENKTMLAQMVDPTVLSAMIQAGLPRAIKFAGVAPIDNTLTGTPGSTVSIPAFEYIGDAVEIAEGAPIDFSMLETRTQEHTIKKVVSAVELTDESVYSGFGNPVAETVRQIQLAVGSEIDNNIVRAALATPLSITGAVNIDMIDRAEAAFIDAPNAIEEMQEGAQGVLFVSHTDANALRAEAGVNFTRASDLGDQILVTGVFGEVLGWQIVRTRKLATGQALFVKTGGLNVFMKRGVMAESSRNIEHQSTQFAASAHFVAALVDPTRVLRVGPAAPIAEPVKAEAKKAKK